MKRNSAVAAMVGILGLIAAIIFINDNGSLPVGPNIEQTVINDIDVSAEGTPVVENVEDIDFTDGNLCIADVAGTAEITFCNDVEIAELLTFGNGETGFPAGDNYIGSGLVGELRIGTPGDMRIIIDNDNNSSGQVFEIRHDTGGLAERVFRVLESGTVLFNGRLITGSNSASCTSNGVGSAQTLSLTVTATIMLVSNFDPDGCVITLSETSAETGSLAYVALITSNGGTISMPDTSGVQETHNLADDIPVWGIAEYMYVSDRWVITDVIQSGGVGGFALNDELPVPDGSTDTNSDYVGVPNTTLYSTSNEFVVANDIYYEPFPVEGDITINRVSFEVTGTPGNPGDSCRVGLFEMTGNHQVGNLVVDWGTLASDSSGWVHGTVSTTIGDGEYLKAFICDSGPSIRFHNSALSRPFGIVDTSTTSTTRFASQLRESAPSGTQHASGFADPGDDWDTVDLSNIGSNRHAILLRWN